MKKVEKKGINLKLNDFQKIENYKNKKSWTYSFLLPKFYLILS